MSYSVGQLYKNQKSASALFTQKTSTLVTISDDNFNNPGVKFSDSSSFAPNVYYYIRFSIDKFYLYPSHNDQIIDLKFFRKLSDNVAAQDDIEYIQTLPKVFGSTESGDKVYFEKIFSPLEEYPYLGFVLHRDSFDESTPRQVTLEVDKIGIINNIKPNGNVPLTKIGLQAKPGSLFCINGEQIRVGKSGVYEINSGIPITFFGTADNEIVNNSFKNNFILDYAYQS